MEVTAFSAASLHGSPRSGSTWLGQIFNSHPEVAYRYQPLFSYAFKNAVTENSGSEEIADFLQRLYRTQDEFVLQTGKAQLGETPQFTQKNEAPSHLLFKEVRYHHLLPLFLEKVPGFKAVGLVRHPGAVVNSFLRTPREWNQAWSPEDEWRFAPSKNRGRVEEYYGFEKWKELTQLFLKLQQARPESFVLVRYEELVSRPRELSQELFQFLGLDWHAQTDAFLEQSRRAGSTGHDHGVFKDPKVATRWREELPEAIAAEIDNELRGTELQQFLSES